MLDNRRQAIEPPKEVLKDRQPSSYVALGAFPFEPLWEERLSLGKKVVPILPGNEVLGLQHGFFPVLIDEALHKLLRKEPLALCIL